MNCQMKKPFNSLKAAMGIARKNEIEKYGKLVSLRPSVTHKDKKKYTRKTKHKQQ